MFNSVALDVVIGMVMIYLLYSLLTTILGEMIASWLGIRARLLRKAIERMLNDGYEIATETNRLKKAGSDIGDFFLHEHQEFRYSLAGRFYNYPLIKYMSQGSRKYLSPLRTNKPSYINAETFARTLIHLLRDKGLGNTDQERIEFSLKHNTNQVQPETLTYLRNLFEDAGKDMNAFADKLSNWFNEMMDRTTGWYKRKLRLILFLLGFFIAVVFNVDSVTISRFLAKDTDARNQLVSIGIAAARDTLRYQPFVKENGDTVRAQAMLDSGFAKVTTDLKQANSVLGLGWNFESLTTGSCEILNVSESMRVRILFPALKLRDTVRSIEKRIVWYSLSSLNTDSLKSVLTSEKKLLDTYINVFNDSMGTCFVKIDSVLLVPNEKASLKVIGEARIGFFEKIAHVISESLPCKVRFWGFLITALMLSLGAPFWFDLLQKLVALRGTGTKPQVQAPIVQKQPVVPSRPIAEVQQTSAAIPQKNELEAAIQKLKGELSSEHGVLDIVPGFKKEKDNMIRVIEVHVNDVKSQKAVGKAIGSKYQKIPVEYLLNTRAVAHMIDCGKTLYNDSSINGVGTLGCFLTRRDSNERYLLSCWHVLKGNFDYMNNVVGPTHIYDSDGIVIARLVDGTLTDRIDIGFAEITLQGSVSNKSIKITRDWRTVLPNETFLPVQFLGATSPNPKTSVVYDTSTPASLLYPDKKMHPFVDLIRITAYNEDGTHQAPSQNGDSGSVLLDQNGVPLGIIVGGDALYTYVAKFANALGPETIFGQYSILLS